jgi:hypothetical protein
MVDWQNLISTFDKEFVDKISKVYHNNIKNSNKFWKSPGDYYGKEMPDHVNEYFNKILLSLNYEVLDLILKNYEYYKDKVFIDNGGGYGLLSIFLDKINIKCYNYDSFSQINPKYISNFIKEINEVHKSKMFDSFPEVTDNVNEIFKKENIDVIVSVGIWVDNPDIQNNPNIKHFILDNKHLINYKTSEFYSKNIPWKGIKLCNSIEGRKHFNIYER